MVCAPGAGASEVLSETLTAGSTADRDCTNRELGTAAADSTSLTTPDMGLIEARLDGGSGDWDLAVFDAESGDTVAGSASAGAEELAQGFVADGQDLVVQACRRSGDSESAELDVGLVALEPVEQRISLINVETPLSTDVTRLQSLGFDLTEHAGDGFVQVVAHGRDDLTALRAEGYSYDIEVRDLAAQSARQRAADEEYANEVEESSLPSGRTTYRRMFDYSEEMKALAEQNPDLVSYFTLPEQTYEGRPVEGIEITTHPENEDGKPVFLNMGLHHAREWPSGEHAMEWAYELISGYRAGDPRVTNLVENSRTIIVPVVNPDGFNISREAGELSGGGGGTSGNDTVNIVSSPYEYRRKNCRYLDEAIDGGSCAQTSVGLAEPGVDPNRNYGGLWGGPGASTDPTAQDYRGPGPFSEPETRNIQYLISRHQVTTLITNHTYSALVLRPPGLASQPLPVDDAPLTALGNAMAAENGYVSQRGYELYDTSGTTEDWSYNATGGFAYTFEIGCNGEPPDDCIGNFHPVFQEAVAEYDGTSALAQAVGGGGNREAYFKAQEAAADPSQHSVIAGRAPDSVLLRLHKEFMTATSRVLTADAREGDRILFQDTLDTVLDVPNSGHFEWHTNPSTRPLVAQDQGRPATGDPSPQETFSGTPGPSAIPCADFDTEDEMCWNDHPFTAPAGPGIDNAKVNVRIDWTTIAADWDMKIFVDSNGDSSSVGETQEVGSSGNGTTDYESSTFAEPLLVPGQAYVARVINWAAVEPYQGTITWSGPEPFEAAHTEAWILTCELPEGNVLGSREITIARGERQEHNLEALCRVSREDARKACKTAPDFKGSGKKDKIKGTPGSDVITTRGGKDKVKSRGGSDIICLGRGKDKASAGGRDDIVIGGGGADVEKGGKGKDQLFGNRSKDVLLGGPGRDRCSGGPGRDRTKSCK
jgi:hypothetical protein